MCVCVRVCVSFEAGFALQQEPKISLIKVARLSTSLRVIPEYQKLQSAYHKGRYILIYRNQTTREERQFRDEITRHYFCSVLESYSFSGERGKKEGGSR